MRVNNKKETFLQPVQDNLDTYQLPLAVDCAAPMTTTAATATATAT